ncbi:hypothetical protein [Caballeronia pedi]|nr:hypothetical protein [Caballeronia pedi]
MQRSSTYLLVASGFAFACLIGFAVRVTFGQPLTGWPRLIALSVGLLSQVLALLAIVVQTIPSILNSLFFRKYAFRRLLCELERDSEYAGRLARYKRSALEQADQYLMAITERRKLFLGAIVGSPEKVALLSLVAMGWSVYKEVPSGPSNWITLTIQYGVALLGGLAFGSLLVNSVIRRYAYQRDLLALALAKLGQDRNAE